MGPGELSGKSSGVLERFHGRDESLKLSAPCSVGLSDVFLHVDDRALKLEERLDVDADLRDKIESGCFMMF